MTGKLLKLARLGPHPTLLVRTLAHQVARRVRERRLRRSYGSLVVRRDHPVIRTDPLEVGRIETLPAELATAAARLRDEAESIVRHEVDYLGSGTVSLGDTIDWQRDVGSGYRWPDAFYLDVEVTRLNDTSDAKLPWELSRGHQLLTLARAFALFGNERFAEELEAQLASWLEANPPGRGINWTNPMEIAIRAVNWIWSVRTLEQRRPLDLALRARLARALAVHARHIEQNLEGSPHLRSNHYLADVLGLLAIGAALDGGEAGRWFRNGHAALEAEIQSQVHDDGLGFEASLPYHGLALEMFLLAKVVADGRRVPFSERYERRLATMLVASASVRHPEGRVPQFGDNDSGRILPAGFARPATADHLLFLGAGVGFPRLLSSRPHEEVAWTLGLAAWERAASAPLGNPPLRDELPHGGVYVLRSPRLHVPVRCGDVGQNGNGGHAHNDLLSFELSCDGTAVIVDSGTYVYTSDPAARNAFRSTAAHNTVAVAGAEINPIDPDVLFALRQVARPSVERFVPGAELVASHDGYRRLPQDVVHRRSFVLDGDRLVVTDQLRGDGALNATGRLHLAAGSEVDVDVEAGVEVGVEVRCGETILQVSIEGADSVEVDDGWISDGYGVRNAAPVVAARFAGRLPLQLVTKIEPQAKT